MEDSTNMLLRVNVYLLTVGLVDSLEIRFDFHVCCGSATKISKETTTDECKKNWRYNITFVCWECIHETTLHQRENRANQKKKNRRKGSNKKNRKTKSRKKNERKNGTVTIQSSLFLDGFHSFQFHQSLCWNHFFVVIVVDFHPTRMCMCVYIYVRSVFTFSHILWDMIFVC